ncbi:hypothetical protein CBF34_08745 [Vagococcus penaei]|uniref:Aldose 1-epimerase n=1 Tax=Vagococcus penaei TaxID=633807 RepID=A0A1Q2D702_9ENTE|nr:aldose epimerase family protein [Vagococcus penaei]AQP54206.1 hypothetical protein BW732_08210 [Vagococcus penaei]RST99990.1 hypothetical protein CBF34_08745 [Vagococcus penaei]
MGTHYNITKDSQTGIHYITLTNGPLTAVFVDFGARLHKWLVPDKSGQQENILLSLDTSEAILEDTAQFGALVGPVAGRIKDAQWKNYQLERNHGQHHIHGGSQGWWHRFWHFDFAETKDSISVIFSLTDTLSGYPGPITVENTYELTKTGITMTTRCQTEEPTIVNPTNHVYFNLSGNTKRDITRHNLMIQAEQRAETDNEAIPTGHLLPVTQTAYDFQTMTRLGDALPKLTNGLDDAYLLSTNTRRPQIILEEPLSGRKLQITTSRQSVVVFSTTGFNANFTVNNQPMSSQLGLALETQELPDIVHHPEWGEIELTRQHEKVFVTTYTVL